MNKVMSANPDAHDSEDDPYLQRRFGIYQRGLRELEKGSTKIAESYEPLAAKHFSL